MPIVAVATHAPMVSPERIIIASILEVVWLRFLAPWSSTSMALTIRVLCRNAYHLVQTNPLCNALISSHMAFVEYARKAKSVLG